VAERGVNRRKRWRGIATRFATRAANDRAPVAVAALMTWLGQ